MIQVRRVITKGKGKQNEVNRSLQYIQENDEKKFIDLKIVQDQKSVVSEVWIIYEDKK